MPPIIASVAQSHKREVNVTTHFTFLSVEDSMSESALSVLIA